MSLFAVSSTARSEWRAHWLVPAVSLVGLAIAFSHIYTTGVFLEPLRKEFGWSRTAVMAGLTIVSVISVILAPFLGAMIDRLGSRRVAIPGLILYCCSFAALGMTTGSLLVWWMLWTAVGLGNVCVKPTVWAAAIARRFEEGRGLAMAVALTGSGMGGMFLPYIASTLIESVGWRQAFAFIGLGNLLIILPLVILFFDRSAPRTETYGSKPDRSSLPGLDIVVALRSARFIKLAIANLIITVSLLALIVHLVPILKDGGLAPHMAAATAGLVGLSTIVGRLGTGFLLDRSRGPLIGVVVFSLPILACILLLLPHSVPMAVATALLLGLMIGSEVDIIMYMASRYFGIRNFGTLYGTLGGLTSLGTGLGPLLAAYIRDRFDSYQPLFWILIPMFATGAILIASLGRYPRLGSETGGTVC